MLRDSPLMAIQIQSLPPVQVTKSVHPRHQFEKYHQLVQAPDAKLGLIVDHLLVSAPVRTFVSFQVDVIAGVRVSADTYEAADHIAVRAYRDTGIEITATASSVKYEHVLVEVFLPAPNALCNLQCDGDGLVIIEDKVLPSNNPYAHIHVRQSGKCKVLMSSLTDMNVESLCLEPKGDGILQLVAPTITLRDRLHVNASALGSVRVFTDKLKVGGALLETAGYGKVQIDARQLEVMATIRMSSVGMGRVSLVDEFVRVDKVTANVSGKGRIQIVPSNEFYANYVECYADGAAEIAIEGPQAQCDVSQLTAYGMGVLNCHSLVARDANVDAEGMGKVHFRASELATAKVRGCGHATIYNPLPPRVSGQANAMVDDQAPTRREVLAARYVAPMALPLRLEAFEHPLHDPNHGLIHTIKSIFHNVVDDETHTPSRP